MVHVRLALLGACAWGCTGQIVGEIARPGGDPPGSDQPAATVPGGRTSGTTTPAAPNGNPGSTSPAVIPPVTGPFAAFYGADHAGMDAGKLTRISPRQYENMVADVLGVKVNLAQVLEPDSVISTGFRVGFDIAPAAVPRYVDAAAATAVTLIDGKGPAAADCLKTAPTAACVGGVADALIARLWRRPVSAADRTALVDVIGKATASGQAAYAFWVYVLMHPSFVYVVEEPRGDGLLDDFEVAARLALTLWRSAPDAALFSAASARALRDPNMLATQVTRMLTQPRATETVNQFFADWMNLKPLSGTTLDAKKFPGWSDTTAASYQKSLQQVFQDAAVGDMMSVLFRTSIYWADAAMLKMLAQPARTGDGAFEFGDNRRGGLLTHPAFLTSTATAAGGDIIHRGIFVRRNALCEKGIPLPEGIDTTLPPPSAAQVTNRDRFDPLLMRQPCGTCHAMFQPFGNALENFDAAGTWRSTDNGRAIDSSGSVRLGLSERDITFSSATDLAQQLAASPQTSACVTRQWFRYALSGPVTAQAGPSLKAAHEAFMSGGHTLDALARAVFTSDAFRRYTPPEN